jgi:hypothetical protein
VNKSGLRREKGVEVLLYLGQVPDREGVGDEPNIARVRVEWRLRLWSEDNQCECECGCVREG